MSTVFEAPRPLLGYFLGVSRGRILRKTWCMARVWDPMPELTIPHLMYIPGPTPTFYHGQPYASVDFTLCHSRLYPTVRDFGFCLRTSTARPVDPQSMYGARVEIGGMYLLSKLERTPLYVLVDIVTGVGREPPPSPGWANFSIIMECTPESCNCHSVCTLWWRPCLGGMQKFIQCGGGINNTTEQKGGQ